MDKVSVRTLTLMLMLLVAVASHQYLAGLKPKASAVWLADDCTPVETLAHAYCPASS
jgi:hypothetical protein